MTLSGTGFSHRGISRQCPPRHLPARVEGPRPLPMRIINRYVDRLQTAAPGATKCAHHPRDRMTSRKARPRGLAHSSCHGFAPLEGVPSREPQLAVSQERRDRNDCPQGRPGARGRCFLADTVVEKISQPQWNRDAPRAVTSMRVASSRVVLIEPSSGHMANPPVALAILRFYATLVVVTLFCEPGHAGLAF